MSRRVVITGMGAVTPLGLNVDEFWNGLKKADMVLDRLHSLMHQNISARL